MMKEEKDIKKEKCSHRMIRVETDRCFDCGEKIEMSATPKDVIAQAEKYADELNNSIFKIDYNQDYNTVLNLRHNLIIKALESYTKDLLQSVVGAGNEEILELETWAKVTKNEQDVKEYKFAAFVMKKLISSLTDIIKKLK